MASLLQSVMYTMECASFHQIPPIISPELRLMGERIYCEPPMGLSIETLRFNTIKAGFAA